MALFFLMGIQACTFCLVWTLNSVLQNVSAAGSLDFSVQVVGILIYLMLGIDIDDLKKEEEEEIKLKLQPILSKKNGKMYIFLTH